MNVLALELQCKSVIACLILDKGLTIFQGASRGDKMSDPDEDEILALFYCLYSDSYTVTGTQGARENCLVGCLAQNSLATSQFDEATLHRLGLGQYSMEFVDSELEIINSLVDKVIAWDPEVFCGFEIQNASWGYLLERAQKEYGTPKSLV